MLEKFALPFLRELAAVRNPALGGVLQWAFVNGHAQNPGAATPMPLLFFVLPICMHQHTAEVLSTMSSRGSLAGFRKKLCKPPLGQSSDKGAMRRGGEYLVAINGRAIKQRQLSLRSLQFAVASQLVRVSSSEATIYAAKPLGPVKNLDLSMSMQSLISSSYNLGKMCSRHTLAEISDILEVRM